MRHLWLVAFLSGGALLLPGRATADLTVATQANFGPGLFNTMNPQPFNPALGTLDSVDVTIVGAVSATATSLPCGLSPCPFVLTVDQNFFGLNPAFFSFETDAQFVFNGIGDNVSFVQGYTYTFTFDAFTDQILNGFTLPNLTLGVGNATQAIPPIEINGTRANFLPTLISSSFNEIDDELSATSDLATGVFFNDAGTLVIQYNYTPAPTPEPSTVLLMVSGLGSLLGRRRWRTNKNSSSSH